MVLPGRLLTSEEVIKWATDMYASDDCIIHEEVKPDTVEGGHWVEAQLWVPDEYAE